MSDQEDTSSGNKRQHASDKSESGSDSEDGWIGPLPTEAVPVKKRKGTHLIIKCP